jgi:hypothetical protein
MSILERVKRICLTPVTEWPIIAGESTPAASLVKGYVAPLAAIGAIAGFVGGSLIGYTVPFVGTYRVPFTAGVASAILAIVLAIAGVLVLSLIINFLAPTFGGEKNQAQALKVAVYSYTPAWVAGVFSILPFLGVLALVGALYGLYLLYLGLPRLMKCPENKAVGYTAVVVVCALVLSLLTGVIAATVVGARALGTGALSGLTGPSAPASGPVADPNSPLGRLEEFGRRIEEGARNAESAAGSGEPGAELSSALGSLGALLGGGTPVDPLAIEVLSTFVPDTFTGLQRTDYRNERTGFGGIMIARAEASYGDGSGKNVELEIVDSGGMSGLMGLASWMGVQGESEDSESRERTRQDGNRIVHEKISKTGGENEFALVLANRFLVSAKGQGVSADELQAAVSRIDLGRLESMKDSGARD